MSRMSLLFYYILNYYAIKEDFVFSSISLLFENRCTLPYTHMAQQHQPASEKEQAELWSILVVAIAWQSEELIPYQIHGLTINNPVVNTEWVTQGKHRELF